MYDDRFSFKKIDRLFRFADIPTQRTEMKANILSNPSTLKPFAQRGIVDKIVAMAPIVSLRADTNEELKTEVDTWYNVMYLNRDEEGNPLATENEIKDAKQNLLERVGHISNWNVSHITNMNNLFNGLSYFNNDISRWDVSNVTSMHNMFYRATRFNQSLNNWDVSNVTSMQHMFYRATRFNQSLNNWNVSNVTDMKYMFSMFRSDSHFN